jgi:hypothetical protein
MAATSTSFLARCSDPRWLACVLALAAGVALSLPTGAATPRFYPDDPLWMDDDRSFDASKVGIVEDSNGYDFVRNTFSTPGDRRDVRAMNVNSVDEVPDSSWFTNRIGRRPLGVDEIVRGPDARTVTSLDGWTVSRGKPTGVQAGFRMKDPNGYTYQIEFDPPSNPEMATGAEIIGTAFYHAFGYHTVEVFLAELDPASIVIAPDAKIEDAILGDKRALTRRDIDDVLRRSARQPNGKYRVIASRFAPGAYLGNFRYYGTRPDDPNDIVPHEHRRELRGARVFGAWLNHDDSRGVNSLDFLTADGSRNYVTHYMFDFGSILGSGTKFAQRHRAGHEYIVEWAPGWLTLATFGAYVRPWMRIAYPDVPPSVGRFEGDAFDPLMWRPEYPNPAFDNMRPDDAFWAARIVSRFSDQAILAVVEKARYSDPRATAYLTQTLVTRRDKVVKTWITAANPVVDLAIDAAGALTFSNAATESGAATAASDYRVRWARFENTTGAVTRLGPEVTVRDTRAQLPSDLTSTPPGGYIEVQVSASHTAHPAWATPVVAHFRRESAGWKLVGLTR